MTKPIQVLLVEDNPADVELTQDMLSASRLSLEFTVAVDGVHAMEILRRQGPHGVALRPDLIVLDLNLPRKDGREVLSELKGDPELRRIPVVILTSSEAERDVFKSYDLGANCYVTKPLDLKAFQAIVQAVEGFWFTIVRLPSRMEVSGTSGR